MLFLSEQAEAEKIKIRTYFEPGSCNVNANKMLMESLVNNLIINAIKQNIPNGTIVISLQNKYLEINSTGTPRELDKAILFRRFGRLSEKTKGSGLGLAIVQQICTLYHWEIKYRYESGIHFFSVYF